MEKTSRIHVLCLNPAIDKFYAIDGFAPGEDYPGQRPRIVSGGKGVNVARVLAQLGMERERIMLHAYLGSGADALAQEMRGLCLCDFYSVKGSCRTTINILDRSSGRETVITEAGPTISPANVRQMMDVLEDEIAKGDIVVCSGSVIDGAPADFYAQVSRLCAQFGAQCMLDCNAAALPASLEGAQYALGKPNERELCAYLGKERTQDPRQIARLARTLTPPYERLLISMGGAGGVLVTKDEAYAAPAPLVNVVSTVGSGDACLAGAVYAQAQGMSMADTLRFAMACGAANAARADAGVGSRKEVLALMETICAQKLDEDV